MRVASAAFREIVSKRLSGQFIGTRMTNENVVGHGGARNNAIDDDRGEAAAGSFRKMKRNLSIGANCQRIRATYPKRRGPVGTLY